MAENPGNSRTSRRDSGIPVTLQALRERAGLGAEDGAGPELREFFAEAKFSGDPDRETAIAMVAIDTILRDPTLLDGTTCFGEGQIDTAVGAARLVLGEKKVAELSSIGGEEDLLQLAEKCREMSVDKDIRAGCVAARHLWGMFNSAVRTFPSAIFRNGSFDNFQAALLAVAGRHIAVFNPDSDDFPSEFSRIAAKAERIAELGWGSKFHREPEGEREVAETILHLAKNGKFSQLRDSSLVDIISDAEPPSQPVCRLLGIRKSKSGGKSPPKEAGTEPGAWTGENVLAGNGAFFAGRTYEEIKSRYPGYPGHSTESSYWDTCTRHPATHGICCRLYSKVPLLSRVGGVEEGLSRAVTNKLVHHNTKFSRLSLWVKLSNGKGFWVHRTRPINWAAHGVDRPPFHQEGQLELFDRVTAGGKGKKGGGGVTVTGFELKAMNYSHMPWVNKAISQYVEEAPFIGAPSDEHQECLSILAKTLREGGLQYREAVERASEIYTLLGGRGRIAAERLDGLVSSIAAKSPACEADEEKLVAILKGRERWSSGKMGGQAAEAIAAKALASGVEMLESLGVGAAEARAMVQAVAGSFPVGMEQDPAAIRRAAGSVSGTSLLTDRDFSELGGKITGLAGRAVRESLRLSAGEMGELSALVGDVMGAGVHDRTKLSGGAEAAQKIAITKFMEKATELAESRGIDRREAEQICGGVLGDAVDISPELEIGLARNGAKLGEKDKGTILAYCAKHADRAPLGGEDLHNRTAAFGGGLTVSLDAPVGEDGKDDLYSVFSAGVDHDSDAEAFGDKDLPHWLDAEIGAGGDSSRPGFMPDGGGEIFSAFGVDSMAENLYRVVSTKGDESQKNLLEDFAALQVEAIGSAGGVEGARAQVSAMLDLLDREDSLPREDAITRRRALTWIFHSVINAIGPDEQGFSRIGGAGAEKMRRELLHKIRRHNMPGILVLKGEPDAADDLRPELQKLRNWGYSRVGVCLPSGGETNFLKWARTGSATDLLLGARNLRRGDLDSLVAGFAGLEDGGLGKAAAAVLSGADNGSGEGALYLSRRKDAGVAALEVIRSRCPDVAGRLRVLRTGTEEGFDFDFLGDSSSAARMADAARIDSVLMVGKGVADEVATRTAEFGLSVAVIDGKIENVLSRHPDYGLLPEAGEGLKKGHLKSSRIPLPRRLMLASMTAQELGVGNQ